MNRSADRTKFKELAEKRVRRALKDLQLIGNLSNRSNYVYTEQDAKKIVKALSSAVADVKTRFDSKGEIARDLFNLD